METWLALPFLPAHDLVGLARAAEAAGLTGVAISDHLCVPSDLQSPYPYGEGKRATIPIDAEFPDPLVTIAALGAVTPRLRFTTHVLLVPLRHPLLLAKEAATASALTGGRLDLGVGAGWMREEFDAIGVPFRHRGRILDEALPLLRRLWTGEPVTHDGHHFRFDAVAVNPVPPSPLRLFVGGHSPSALCRAAALGDGWVGVSPTIEELAELLDSLRSLRTQGDRREHPFEIRTGMRGPLTTESVRTMRALGVTSLVVAPWQLAAGTGSTRDVSAAAIAARLPELVERVAAA